MCRREAFASVDNLLQKVEAREQIRLAKTEADKKPLVLRLADRYGLTGGEADFFQLLFVRGASKILSLRTFLREGRPSLTHSNLILLVLPGDKRLFRRHMK